MKNCTAYCSCGPEVAVKDATVPDPLTELLRKGARDIIAKAVEAELEDLLEDYPFLCLEDGRAVVAKRAQIEPPARSLRSTGAL